MPNHDATVSNLQLMDDLNLKAAGKSTYFHRAIMIIIMVFFSKNFILIYKLNIQIQISLIIGNLYSADLITGIPVLRVRMLDHNATAPYFCRQVTNYSLV